MRQYREIRIKTDKNHRYLNLSYFRYYGRRGDPQLRIFPRIAFTDIMSPVRDMRRQRQKRIEI